MKKWWRCVYQSGALQEIVDTLNFVILKEFNYIHKGFDRLGASIKIVQYLVAGLGTAGLYLPKTSKVKRRQCLPEPREHF